MRIILFIVFYIAIYVARIAIGDDVVKNMQKSSNNRYIFKQKSAASRNRVSEIDNGIIQMINKHNRQSLGNKIDGFPQNKKVLNNLTRSLRKRKKHVKNSNNKIVNRWNNYTSNNDINEEDTSLNVRLPIWRVSKSTLAVINMDSTTNPSIMETKIINRPLLAFEKPPSQLENLDHSVDKAIFPIARRYPNSRRLFDLNTSNKNLILSRITSPKSEITVDVQNPAFKGLNSSNKRYLLVPISKNLYVLKNVRENSRTGVNGIIISKRYKLLEKDKDNATSANLSFKAHMHHDVKDVGRAYRKKGNLHLFDHDMNYLYSTLESRVLKENENPTKNPVSPSHPDFLHPDIAFQTDPNLIDVTSKIFEEQIVSPIPDYENISLVDINSRSRINFYDSSTLSSPSSFDISNYDVASKKIANYGQLSTLSEATLNEINPIRQNGGNYGNSLKYSEFGVELTTTDFRNTFDTLNEYIYTPATLKDVEIDLINDKKVFDTPQSQEDDSKFLTESNEDTSITNFIDDISTQYRAVFDASANEDNIFFPNITNHFINNGILNSQDIDNQKYGISISSEYNNKMSTHSNDFYYNNRSIDEVLFTNYTTEVDSFLNKEDYVTSASLLLNTDEILKKAQSNVVENSNALLMSIKPLSSELQKLLGAIQLVNQSISNVQSRLCDKKNVGSARTEQESKNRNATNITKLVDKVDYYDSDFSTKSFNNQSLDKRHIEIGDKSVAERDVKIRRRTIFLNKLMTPFYKHKSSISDLEVQSGRRNFLKKRKLNEREFSKSGDRLSHSRFNRNLKSLTKNYETRMKPIRQFGLKKMKRTTPILGLSRLIKSDISSKNFEGGRQNHQKNHQISRSIISPENTFFLNMSGSDKEKKFHPIDPQFYKEATAYLDILELLGKTKKVEYATEIWTTQKLTESLPSLIFTTTEFFVPTLTFLPYFIEAPIITTSSTIAEEKEIFEITKSSLYEYITSPITLSASIIPMSTTLPLFYMTKLTILSMEETAISITDLTITPVVAITEVTEIPITIPMIEIFTTESVMLLTAFLEDMTDITLKITVPVATETLIEEIPALTVVTEREIMENISTSLATEITQSSFIETNISLYTFSTLLETTQTELMIETTTFIVSVLTSLATASQIATSESVGENITLYKTESTTAIASSPMVLKQTETILSTSTKIAITTLIPEDESPVSQIEKTITAEETATEVPTTTETPTPTEIIIITTETLTTATEIPMTIEATTITETSILTEILTTLKTPITEETTSTKTSTLSTTSLKTKTTEISTTSKTSTITETSFIKTTITEILLINKTITTAETPTIETSTASKILTISTIPTTIATTTTEILTSTEILTTLKTPITEETTSTKTSTLSTTSLKTTEISTIKTTITEILPINKTMTTAETPTTIETSTASKILTISTIPTTIATTITTEILTSTEILTTYKTPIIKETGTTIITPTETTLMPIETKTTIETSTITEITTSTKITEFLTTNKSVITPVGTPTSIQILTTSEIPTTSTIPTTIVRTTTITETLTPTEILTTYTTPIIKKTTGAKILTPIETSTPIEIKITTETSTIIEISTTIETTTISKILTVTETLTTTETAFTETPTTSEISTTSPIPTITEITAITETLTLTEIIATTKIPTIKTTVSTKGLTPTITETPSSTETQIITEILTITESLGSTEIPVTSTTSITTVFFTTSESTTSSVTMSPKEFFPTPTLTTLTTIITTETAETILIPSTTSIITLLQTLITNTTLSETLCTTISSMFLTTTKGAVTTSFKTAIPTTSLKVTTTTPLPLVTSTMSSEMPNTTLSTFLIEETTVSLIPTTVSSFETLHTKAALPIPTTVSTIETILTISSILTVNATVFSTTASTITEEILKSTISPFTYLTVTTPSITQIPIKPIVMDTGTTAYETTSTLVTSSLLTETITGTTSSIIEYEEIKETEEYYETTREEIATVTSTAKLTTTEHTTWITTKEVTIEETTPITFFTTLFSVETISEATSPVIEKITLFTITKETLLIEKIVTVTPETMIEVTLISTETSTMPTIETSTTSTSLAAVATTALLLEETATEITETSLITTTTATLLPTTKRPEYATILEAAITVTLAPFSELILSIIITSETPVTTSEVISTLSTTVSEEFTTSTTESPSITYTTQISILLIETTISPIVSISTEPTEESLEAETEYYVAKEPFYEEEYEEYEEYDTEIPTDKWYYYDEYETTTKETAMTEYTELLKEKATSPPFIEGTTTSLYKIKTSEFTKYLTHSETASTYINVTSTVATPEISYTEKITSTSILETSTSTIVENVTTVKMETELTASTVSKEESTTMWFTFGSTEEYTLPSSTTFKIPTDSLDYLTIPPRYTVVERFTQIWVTTPKFITKPKEIPKIALTTIPEQVSETETTVEKLTSFFISSTLTTLPEREVIEVYATTTSTVSSEMESIKTEVITSAMTGEETIPSVTPFITSEAETEITTIKPVFTTMSKTEREQKEQLLQQLLQQLDNLKQYEKEIMEREERLKEKEKQWDIEKKKRLKMMQREKEKEKNITVTTEGYPTTTTSISITSPIYTIGTNLTMPTTEIEITSPFEISITTLSLVEITTVPIKTTLFSITEKITSEIYTTEEMEEITTEESTSVTYTPEKTIIPYTIKKTTSITYITKEIEETQITDYITLTPYVTTSIMDLYNIGLASIETATSYATKEMYTVSYVFETTPFSITEETISVTYTMERVTYTTEEAIEETTFTPYVTEEIEETTFTPYVTEEIEEALYTTERSTTITYLTEEIEETQITDYVTFTPYITTSVVDLYSIGLATIETTTPYTVREIYTTSYITLSEPLFVSSTITSPITLVTSKFITLPITTFSTRFEEISVTSVTTPTWYTTEETITSPITLVTSKFITLPITTFSTRFEEISVTSVTTPTWYTTEETITSPITLVTSKFITLPITTFSTRFEEISVTSVTTPTWYTTEETITCPITLVTSKFITLPITTFSTRFEKISVTSVTTPTWYTTEETYIATYTDIYGKPLLTSSELEFTLSTMAISTTTEIKYYEEIEKLKKELRKKEHELKEREKILLEREKKLERDIMEFNKYMKEFEKKKILIIPSEKSTMLTSLSTPVPPTERITIKAQLTTQIERITEKKENRTTTKMGITQYTEMKDIEEKKQTTSVPEKTVTQEEEEIMTKRICLNVLENTTIPFDKRRRNIVTKKICLPYFPEKNEEKKSIGRLSRRLLALPSTKKIKRSRWDVPLNFRHRRREKETTRKIDNLQLSNYEWLSNITKPLQYFKGFSRIYKKMKKFPKNAMQKNTTYDFQNCTSLYEQHVFDYYESVFQPTATFMDSKKYGKRNALFRYDLITTRKSDDKASVRKRDVSSIENNERFWSKKNTANISNEKATTKEDEIYTVNVLHLNYDEEQMHKVISAKPDEDELTAILFESSDDIYVTDFGKDKKITTPNYKNEEKNEDNEISDKMEKKMEEYNDYIEDLIEDYMNYKEHETSTQTYDGRLLDNGNKDKRMTENKTELLNQAWPTEKNTMYHLGGTRLWELDFVTEPTSDVLCTTDKSKTIDGSLPRTTCFDVVLKRNDKIKSNISYYKHHLNSNKITKHVSIKNRDASLENITRMNALRYKLRTKQPRVAKKLKRESQKFEPNHYKQESFEKKRIVRLNDFRCTSEHSTVKNRKLCIANANKLKRQIVRHKDTNKHKKKQVAKSRTSQNLHSLHNTDNGVVKKKNAYRKTTTANQSLQVRSIDDKKNSEKVTHPNIINRKNKSMPASHKQKIHNCFNCICNIASVINNIRSVFDRTSFSLDEIKALNCSEYKEIQDKIVISMDSDMEEAKEFPQPHYNIESLKGQKYIKLGELENNLKINSELDSDNDVISLPGLNLNLPCNQDGNAITWISSISRPSYTWKRTDGIALFGFVTENGDLELRNVNAKDTGNYTCVMKYMSPDNEESVETTYEIHLQVVTLPRYIVHGENRYHVRSCDEEDLDMLITYLPPKLNNIICEADVCNAYVLTPSCSRSQITVNILLVPSHIVKLMTVDPKRCNVFCLKAIQDKLSLILSKNLQIFLEKTIIFRLPHYEQRLVPIVEKSSFARRKRGKTDANVSTGRSSNIGLFSSCPAGYGLRDTHCVPCNVGTYSEDGTSHCKRCPPGTYQPNHGARVCRTCTNPTTKGCYNMLWNSFSAVMVTLASIGAILLICLLLLWIICCAKKKFCVKRIAGLIIRENTFEKENVEEQPLIKDANENEDQQWDSEYRIKKKKGKFYLYEDEWGSHRIKNVPIISPDSYRSHEDYNNHYPKRSCRKGPRLPECDFDT